MSDEPHDEDLEERRLEQIEREATWLWYVARIAIAYQGNPLIMQRDPLIQVATGLRTLSQIDGDELKKDYLNRAVDKASDEIGRLQSELEIAKKVYAVLSKPPAEFARALINLV